MLHQVKGQRVAAPVRGLGYTPYEWDVIAHEMKRRWPARVFNRYDFNGFSLEDFEDAMDAVIPQEKQRAVESFSEIRGYLFEAFQRIYKDGGGVPQVTFTPQQTDRKQYIKWKPKQWEMLLLEYNKLFPGEFSNRLAECLPRKIAMAMECLPIDERRKIGDVRAFRDQALKYWDAIPASEKTKHLQDRAVAQFSNAVIAQPVPLAIHSSQPMASAINKAFEKTKEPVKAKAPSTSPKLKPVQTLKQRTGSSVADHIARPKDAAPIHWSKEEWDAIAREMIRQNPFERYIGSELAGLEMEALRAAQRVVIDKERRRYLVDRAAVRPKLIKAFQRIAHEYEAKHEPASIPVTGHAEAKVAEEAVVTVSEQLTVEAVQAQVVEQVSSVVDTSIHAAAQSITHVLAAAATPLLSTVMSHIAKAFVPEITKTLLPELTKTISAQIAAEVAKIKIPAPVIQQSQDTYRIPVLPTKAPYEAFEQHQKAPVAAPVVALSPTPVAIAKEAAKAFVAASSEAFEQPAPKAAKPLIAMIGPLGKQKSELERAYPHLEMMFIENGKGISRAAEKCSLFLASTKHMPRNIAQSVKDCVPKEKLVYFDGAISMIRREIDTWQNKAKA